MNGRIVVGGVLLVAFCLSGCTKENPAYQPPAPVCEDEDIFSIQRYVLPAAGRLDILVVADRLAGTVEMRRSFGAGLADALAQAEGLDWQIGVVSSDLTTSQHDGFLQPTRATDDCAADPSLLLAGEGVTAEALACRLETLGAVESHPAMPLGAARRALDRAFAEDVSPNAGLLREGSRLLIVVLGATGDCSGSQRSRDAGACVADADDATAVSELVRYFAETVDGRRSRLVARPTLAVVGGPAGETGESTCRVGDLELTATPRVRSFAHQLGEAAWIESGCTTTLAPFAREVIGEVASPTAIPVCVQEPMVGAPVDVQLGPDDGGAALSEIGDYLVEPRGGVCANGGISLNGDRLSDAGGEALRIRFCRSGR
ncbi:MAG: hypothetical protein EA398_06605 [Deltaproteobacteria bacterium]|nr:MAG: hypothetical protein EA398_06605 [Deltaproteobacteria bacterium]